jgi:hypothetical protein
VESHAYAYSGLHSLKKPFIIGALPMHPITTSRLVVRFSLR